MEEKPTYNELRTEALNWRATAEKYRDAQQIVAEATKKRGYREGWSDQVFLARQVVKLLEELGEMSYPIHQMPHMFNHYGHPDNEGFEDVIDRIGNEASYLFDEKDPETWIYIFVRYDALEDMKSEAADCMVVLFNIADTLERMSGEKFDIIQEAIRKAQKDISRGVR